MTPELILIDKIKVNNRNAFREFVELYKSDVYSMAYRLTGNHSDADDLSQVVFIKFFKTVNNYRQEAGVKTWLYKIAVNSHIDKERKKVNKIIFRFNQDFDDQTPFEETIETDKANPEQIAESKIINTHVKHALTKLSAKEKSVFILKHYQDQTLKEIAQAINTSEGTVKSLLFRGIKKLQSALAFYKPELGLGDQNG